VGGFFIGLSMKISTRGLIEIASHEGICLDWYLDSVGVPTIGIGQTKYDGFDPRTAGHLTIEQVFELFKRKIKDYERPVNALGLTLKQHQYDALVSFCYNVGPGNLAKLCKDRSLAQIGEALMLYVKPPEVAGRRKKEQTLFQTGKYSNTDGRVLVFPVEEHKPRYSKGYTVDVRPFFDAVPPPPDVEPVEPKPKPPVRTITSTGVGAGTVIGATFAPDIQTAAFILGAGLIVALVVYLIWPKKD
jgi:lysozyme